MIDRRSFLRTLGLGLGAVAVAPLIVEAEPARRFWQVGRAAPVGHRAGDIVSVRIGGREFLVDQEASVRLFSPDDGYRRCERRVFDPSRARHEIQRAFDGWVAQGFIVVPDRDVQCLLRRAT